MTIDTVSLKKFVETFGPAVEAIPAVLDAVAKQADMDRALKSQRKELEKLKVDTVNTVEQAESALLLANESREQAVKEKEKAQAEARVLISDANQKILDNQAISEEKLKAAKSKLDDVIAKCSMVESDYETKTKALQADFTKAAEQLEMEIKELEKRKASVEKSIENLKAKLG